VAGVWPSFAEQSGRGAAPSEGSSPHQTLSAREDSNAPQRSINSTSLQANQYQAIDRSDPLGWPAQDHWKSFLALHLGTFA
jgi:hypothetical protein